MLGLNDNDMMVKIKKKLVKTEENKDVTSGQTLLWARRVEAQRTEVAVLKNLKVEKEFHAIQSEKPNKHMQILWIQPPTSKMPSVWEEMCGVCQDEPG